MIIIIERLFSVVTVVHTDQKQEHARTHSDGADVTWELKVHTVYSRVFNLINWKRVHFKEKKKWTDNRTVTLTILTFAFFWTLCCNSLQLQCKCLEREEVTLGSLRSTWLREGVLYPHLTDDCLSSGALAGETSSVNVRKDLVLLVLFRQKVVVVFLFMNT